MDEDFLPARRYPRRSLRDFYTVILRHKWKGILCFLLVLLTVALTTFLAPHIYRAHATLLLRWGRENATVDPTAASSGQIVTLNLNRENEINSELEILKGRELAETVVDGMSVEQFLRPPAPGNFPKDGRRVAGLPEDLINRFQNRISALLERLNLRAPLTEREQAVLNFTKSLKVETQKNSSIISLCYEAYTPKDAQVTLVRVIDIYRDKHTKAHRTQGSFEFFDGQSEKLHTDLRKLEDELRNLKNQTGVASLEEQRKVIVGRLAALRQEEESTNAALAISQKKVENLNQKLADLPATLVTVETRGTPNAAADQMRARLYELQLREKELLSKYKESYPDVREIRKQIAEAEKVLGQEESTRTQVTTGVNLVHQQVDLALISERANVQSLRSKAEVIKRQREEAERKILDLNNTELKMVGMQRELALQEAKYRKYAENREQARIDQALEMKKISNINLVQAPTASLKPVRPQKLINLALGLFLGIFAALGLTFLCESLDHSIKTPQDVEEKLQVPLLASVPYLKKSKSRALLANVE